MELSTFYQNRAAAYENLKDYEKIIEDCSSALELNVKYVKALTRRAKALEQTKRLVDCLDDVSLACALEPNPSTFMTLERWTLGSGRWDWKY
jgi:import receptor subunit TOM70